MGTIKDKVREEAMNLIHSNDEETRKGRCRNEILSMMCEVMGDTMKVFDFGAQKHPDSVEHPNFLMTDGNRCSLKDRGSSVLRHAARTFMNPKLKDEESNLEELLHLISSASILYIRQKRNITHPEDLK